MICGVLFLIGVSVAQSAMLGLSNKCWFITAYLGVVGNPGNLPPDQVNF
jgi:hypothetical protein